jgi:hypothetical protein
MHAIIYEERFLKLEVIAEVELHEFRILFNFGTGLRYRIS